VFAAMGKAALSVMLWVAFALGICKGILERRK
jgi:hypothetical protein